MLIVISVPTEQLLLLEHTDLHPFVTEDMYHWQGFPWNSKKVIIGYNVIKLVFCYELSAPALFISMILKHLHSVKIFFDTLILMRKGHTCGILYTMFHSLPYSKKRLTKCLTLPHTNVTAKNTFLMETLLWQENINIKEFNLNTLIWTT